MTNVIAFEYKGQPVSFNTDGWINATEVAGRHGKRPVDWLKQEETKEYLTALGEALNCDPGSLLKTQRGRYHSGTWLHPKLGVRFAQWLDVRFAVWCDLHIDAVLRGELNAQQQYDQACKRLETRKEMASSQGRGLAAWRWEKQPLEAQVEYWRDQLQMTLALDSAA